MNPAETPQTPAAAPGAPAAPEPVTGADLLAALPPVNERALSAVPGAAPAANPPAAAAPGVDQERDASGRVFDPRVFRTDKATGKPYRNAAGNFMPRGGRKPKLAGEQMKFRSDVMNPKATGSTVPAVFPGQTPAAPAQAPSANPGPVPATPAPAAVDIKALELTAESYLRVGYAAANATLKAETEWNPDDQEEHAGMRAALVAYQASNQGKPLSPGVALLVTIAGYIGKRITRSKTAKTLAEWWAALSSKTPRKSDQAAAPGQTPAAPTPAPSSAQRPQISITPL